MRRAYARLLFIKMHGRRAPTRSASLVCGVAAASAFGRREGCARAISDAFDSPQLARTIVTCSKSRAPLALAPRRRRPQNKEAVLRRLYFARQPDPTPTAEGRKTRTDARRTMFCATERRQPLIYLPLYSAVWSGGGVGSGCAAERSVPTAGGLCVVAQGLLSAARIQAPVQNASPVSSGRRTLT